MKFSVSSFRTVGDVLLHTNDAGFEFIVDRIKWGRRGPSHIRTEKVLVESSVTVSEYLEMRKHASPRYIVNGLSAMMSK